MSGDVNEAGSARPEPAAIIDLTSQGLTDVILRDQRQLVRLASLLAGSTSDAEDVVQDVFETVLRRGLVLRDQQAAHAYVRRAVVNRCRALHRRRRLQYLREQLFVAQEPPLDARDEDATVLRGSLALALQALPPRQRAVVVLRYYCGLGDGETAMILGITQGAVRSNAVRGLQKLRITWSDNG